MYEVHQTYHTYDGELETGDFAYCTTLAGAMSELINATKEQCKSAFIVHNNKIVHKHECFERDYYIQLAQKFASFGGMAALYAQDCEGLPIEKAYLDLVDAVDASHYHAQAIKLVETIEPCFDY